MTIHRPAWPSERAIAHPEAPAQHQRVATEKIAASLQAQDHEFNAWYDTHDHKGPARVRRHNVVYQSSHLPLFGGDTNPAPGASGCRKVVPQSGSVPEPVGRDTFYHEPSHKLLKNDRRKQRWARG